MKHGYGNFGAIPIPGTAGVWVLPGYYCMRTPGVLDFFQQQKISGIVFGKKIEGKQLAMPIGQRIIGGSGG
jgi:hypothetical protein